MGLSTQEVALLVTAFTFPGIFLSPFFGVIADRIGRKNVVVPSLFLFGGAGFACSFAQDFTFLFVMRVLQGVGASSLGSLNATMISDLFKGNERITAMGYNSGVLSVGATIYPAIGGGLALFGWQYPFLLPLIAIPVGFLVMFRMNITQPDNVKSLKNYFIELGLALRQTRILVLFFTSILSFILLYGPILTYLPFFIEDRFGGDSLAIGLIVSCVAISNRISSSVLGKLALRFGEGVLLKVSFLIYMLAFLLIPVVSNLWLLALPVLLYGWGQGVNLPNILNQISKEAPEETRGAVLAINGTVLRLGQTLGPVIVGIFFGWFSFEGVYWISAIIALLTALMLWLLFRN